MSAPSGAGSRLARGARAAAFQAALKVLMLRRLPAMTRVERSVYEKLLLAMPFEERLDVFEYGSGFSTLYFARFLEAKRVPFHIHSVDNHAGWHARVGELVRRAGLDDRVTLHLHEFPPAWDKPGWDWSKPPACGEFAPSTDAEHAYIDLPAAVGVSFDLIVVDARFRRRCLEKAPGCLAPRGVVLLHDAQKAHYQGSLDSWTHSRFVRSGGYYPFDPGGWRMWLGSMDNPLVDELGEER